MRFLVLGCSHIAGSYSEEDPLAINPGGSFLTLLAEKYPKDNFSIVSFPGQGFARHYEYLKKVQLNDYDRVLVLGSYYRLAYPAVYRGAVEGDKKIIRYQRGNYHSYISRHENYYTLFPPHCIDWDLYHDRYKSFIAALDPIHTTRKMEIIINLMKLEYPTIRFIEWGEVLEEMDQLNLPYQNHILEDGHFTEDGQPYILNAVESLLGDFLKP